jgi:hypothetical protein
MSFPTDPCGAAARYLTEAMDVVDHGSDWFNIELDSHANTCCVGNKTRGRVKVTPFTKSLGTVTKVIIVKAAIAYYNPHSGQVYILILNQA